MKMQRCSKHGCEYLVSCTLCDCENIINSFNAPFASKMIHFASQQCPCPGCERIRNMDNAVDKASAELVGPPDIIADELTPMPPPPGYWDAIRDLDYKIQNDTPNGDFAREYAEQKERDRAEVESLIRSIK